ncbi:MAG: NAD-dependent epimerase/dehydratase family protein [Hyphomicrobiaceae bacterium]
MRDGTVLVTGASGFLAAWTIPKLLAAGRRVVAADLKRDDTRLNLVTRNQPLPDLTWVEFDVGDEQACRDVTDSHQPVDILHLAALMIPACRSHPVAGARVNLLGHLNMLEAARAVGARLTYTSSAAAKPRGPANAPANLYGVYKRADEEISRLFAEDFGVPSLGLRPNMVYGVGRDLGDTAVITAAARAAACGEGYVLPWRARAGVQLVDDIAEIFCRVVQCEWQGAMVSDMGTMLTTTEEIVDSIRAVVPDAAISIDGPERPVPTDGFEIDALAAIIGPLPQTPIGEGMAQTIAHFQDLREMALI